MKKNFETLGGVIKKIQELTDNDAFTLKQTAEIVPL